MEVFLYKILLLFVF